MRNLSEIKSACKSVSMLLPYLYGNSMDKSWRTFAKEETTEMFGRVELGLISCVEPVTKVSGRSMALAS